MIQGAGTVETLARVGNTCERRAQSPVLVISYADLIRDTVLMGKVRCRDEISHTHAHTRYVIYYFSLVPAWRGAFRCSCGSAWGLQARDQVPDGCA